MSRSATRVGVPRTTSLSVALLDQVCAIEDRSYPWPWSRGNFIDSMASGHHCTCRLDAHGAVLAYLVAMDGVEETHLLNITVAPEWRGHGLARALLDDLVVRSRALGAQVLWLEVRPSNAAARRLYERYGFEEVGRRRAYYPDGDGGREDALVMRLWLSPASTQEDGHALV